MGRNRRRSQLVQPSSQLRIVAYAVLVGLLALLVNLSLLFFGLESAFARAGSDPAALRTELRDMVLRQGLYAAGLVVPLAACAGIVISFQIFGPLYRFEKYLDEVASGNLTQDCFLRRGDDLPGLESAVLRMVDRFRDDFHRDREAFACILDELEELEAYLSESQHARLDYLRKRVREAIERGPTIEPAPAEATQAPA